MNFFGQESIRTLLSNILSNYNHKTHASLLFIGDSGTGKTHIASEFLSQLRGRYSWQNVADNPNNLIKWDSTMEHLKSHLIDEIHLATNPEMLYYKIDSKRYIICLCTTDYGGLHRSLLTRCIPVRLIPYDDTSIKQIVLDYARREDLELTIDAGNYISSLSRKNPRRAKQLVDLLILNLPRGYRRHYNVKEIFESQGIYKDGYTQYDLLYLKELENVGGIASLSTMANILNLDMDYIVKFIEPFLLQKGRISITRRGRVLKE